MGAVGAAGAAGAAGAEGAAPGWATFQAERVLLVAEVVTGVGVLRERRRGEAGLGETWTFTTTCC